MKCGIRRDGRFEFIKGRLHRRCDGQGVEIGLFVNDEHHTGQAIDGGTPNAVGSTNSHVRHMSQRQAHTVSECYRDSGQIIRVFDARPLPDWQSLILSFDESRSTKASSLPTRGQHVIECHTVLV